MPLVSLVLPAFNEAANLADAVAGAAAALDGLGRDWQIVVVDDGSTDGTGDLADQIAARDPRVVALRHPENRGKGAALKTGMALATAPVVGYTDTDLPFDMEALVRAYARLTETGADLVAGVRVNRERYSLRRRVVSGAYNTLVRAILGLPLDDLGFALKMMRRETFERAELESDGGFVCVELIAKTYAAGLQIERVGVEFTPRTRGTSTMAGPASVAGIVWDLVRYRLGLVRAGRLGRAARTPA